MHPKQGLFPWFSLNTTHPEKAVEYYKALLGHTIETFEIPGHAKGYMLSASGNTFADVSQVGIPQNPGDKSYWLTQIAVQSLDEYLPKVPLFGGKALTGIIDLGEIGRIAMVMDPEGGVFSAYESRDIDAISTGMGMKPGELCWVELMCKNPERAKPFYEKSFGWTFKPDRGDGYHEFSKDGVDLGGFLKIRPEMGPTPSAWMVYFLVASIEESAKRNVALGGVPCTEIMTIPNVGKFQVVNDPTGACYYLFELTSRK